MRGLTVKLNKPKSSWFTIRSKFDTESSAYIDQVVIFDRYWRRLNDILDSLDWTCFCEYSSELFL
jgi:hypothetical protein